MRDRKLEKLITGWQNSFRKKIYTGELSRYKEIGNEKLEEFFLKFEKKFDEFF